MNDRQKSKRIFLIALSMFLFTINGQIHAQNNYLGEIKMFAGNFAPNGWAFCDGSLLQIADNTALFSLLGTMYGGDGITTFALPDLRGRVPLDAGQGVGLTNRDIGELGGQETHTLMSTEMPAHNHSIAADSSIGTTDRPVNGVPARNASGIPHYGNAQNAFLKSNTIGSSGGGLPHNNMQPYAVVNFIIALQGIFPSRN